MLVWLLIGTYGTYFVGSRVVRARRARRRVARDRLEEMLKGTGVSPQEISAALDAYRDQILSGRGADGETDWQECFHGASEAVRDLFGGIVVVQSFEEPEQELEALQAGLQVYPDAHTRLLVHNLHEWIRRLRRIGQISEAEYLQRMATVDFIDPEQKKD